MHSTLAAVAITLMCGTALAQAPQLPPPDAVSLDRLIHEQLPADPRSLVDQSNRTKYPQMRWALQHTRELLPTRNIRRGSGPVALPVRSDLDGVLFQDDKGHDVTVDRMAKRPTPTPSS